LTLQSKTTNGRVVINREDMRVGDRETAEVNTPGHGISAVIELLSGLRIDCVKHGRTRVQQPLVFSTFLVGILSGRESKKRLRSPSRIRQIEISQDPFRFQDWSLGLRIRYKLASHDASVRIVAV